MKPREERMRELLESAERMAGGDVAHRAAISPAHDELDALAFAMNVIVGELSYAARVLGEAKEEAELRNAELAAAQGNLVRTERLALLGQLAGGVAHQIRNPLAAIMNASFVLKRHLPHEAHPDVVSSIGIIQDEIRHANVIITGLLDFARVRAPNRRSTCVVELVDGVIRTGLVPTNISIVRLGDGDIPRLDIDPDHVREALLNVVRNAVEAMPAGGTLEIELTASDDCVVIAVGDSGPGIAPELRGRVFEPLRSTKPFGVGLGLVTARTLIEAHGGQLAAVPASRGARFELRLPR